MVRNEVCLTLNTPDFVVAELHMRECLTFQPNLAVLNDCNLQPMRFVFSYKFFAAIQEQEAAVSEQLEAVTAETESIKEELSRLEDRNNQLQGYGLDNMSAEELSGLIHGLTQVCQQYVILLVDRSSHLGYMCDY